MPSSSDQPSNTSKPEPIAEKMQQPNQPPQYPNDNHSLQSSQFNEDDEDDTNAPMIPAIDDDDDEEETSKSATTTNESLKDKFFSALSNIISSPSTTTTNSVSTSQQTHTSSTEQDSSNVVEGITLTSTIEALKLNLSSWSLPELLFGIRYMHKEKQKRDFSEMQKRKLPIDSNLVESLKYYQHHCRICNQIDNKPRQNFLDLTGISEDDCIEYQVKANFQRNGYTIIIDHDMKEIVLYLNGTQSVQDLISDCNGKACQFLNGYAHFGMAAFARWFFINKTKTLYELRENNPSYQIVIAGHSLGASCATLVGLMMRETFSDLKVIAFATPRCVSEELIPITRKFVRSFVYMDDFVPLMSMVTIQELRDRVTTSNWKHHFYKDINESSAFKTIMRIAPNRFVKYWKQIGEDHCSLKTKEELEEERRARALSEKQRIDWYYQKEKQNSSPQTPQPQSPQIEIQTQSETKTETTQESADSSKSSSIRPLFGLWQRTPTKRDEDSSKTQSVSSTSVEAFTPTTPSAIISGDGKRVPPPPPKHLTLETPNQSDDQLNDEVEPQEVDSASTPTAPASQFEETQSIALHIPGDILYIRHIDHEWCVSEEVFDSRYFRHLEFNRHFLSDHLCASYLRALQEIIQKHNSKQQYEDKKKAQEKFSKLLDMNDVM